MSAPLLLRLIFFGRKTDEAMEAVSGDGAIIIIDQRWRNLSDVPSLSSYHNLVFRGSELSFVSSSACHCFQLNCDFAALLEFLTRRKTYKGAVLERRGEKSREPEGQD